jgi:hypothetical protein
MKNQIMEKLVNNQELSTSEIVFLNRNLPGEDNQEAISMLPFNHDEKKVFEAVGLNRSKMDTFVEKMKQVSEKVRESEDSSMSRLIEELEALAMSTPENTRALVTYFVKVVSSNPLAMILGKLMGGDSGPKDDDDE